VNIDTRANRRATKYSRIEQIRRIGWAAAWPLFRLSPRILFGWRNFLLRLFGARIGKEVHIYNTARISLPWQLEVGDWSAIGDRAIIYNLGKISIGMRVTISQGAHLCAGSHDYSDPSLSLLKPPITVEDQAWVCADSFIGPGVTVGEGAVVGARAVVTKDVTAWDVVAGNPARVIKRREIRIGT
jgi:putative colanic acid biosynthesis acetyltransferase WcaF